MTLTSAQLRELIRVRDTGHSKTRAGYTNRVAGRTEFVWQLRDGSKIGDSEIPRDDWYNTIQGAYVVGEQLTELGRRALGKPNHEGEG